MSDEAPKDWKLKLHYGQTDTRYEHFAMVADGEVLEANADFKTEVGPCVLSMKAWAKDTEEAAEMMIAISNHLGFKMAGKIDIYATEPDAPPKEKPYGYDLKFTPYEGTSPTVQ
jgi:hypothetical protein